MKIKTINTQVKHINKIYNISSINEKINGGNWYKEANEYAEHLNKLFNIDSKVKICGIISALSPACTWERNKIDAHNFLALSKFGNDNILTGNYSTYKNNVRKAIEIFNLENPNKDKIGKILKGKTGLKTESFFYNIYDLDSENVTIDRHAIKVANNFYKGGGVSITEKQYRLCESAYKKVSKKYDLKPHQLQAIVWITYRRLRNLK